MAEQNLEEKIDAGFRGVNARFDTLDGRVHALDESVNARLDTLDEGFTQLRADIGQLKTHVDEVRDALLADNLKTRGFVSIQVESLREEVKAYGDGVITHKGKLEDHETRITKLELR